MVCALVAAVWLGPGFLAPAALADQGAVRADVAGSLSPFVADTLVVRASALNDPVAPAAGGVVTRIELDRGPGGRDLAQELSRVAGLQFRRYGGAGFAAVPALRGASAAQVRLFLDGMPLNGAQTGQVDLSLVPVDRLAAAEVHRGAVPTGWGGMGGAGAINLISREQAAGTEADVFTGAFGGRGGRVSWGAGSDDGRSTLLLLAHGRRADNDYTFRDHNQTFFETADDTLRRRANAWFEEYGYWGSARQRLGAFTARIAGGFFRKDGGRPGPLDHPSPHAGVRDQQASGQVRLDWDSRLSLEVSAARDRQQLHDPMNEIEDGFGGVIRSRGDDVTARLAWSGPLWRSEGPRGLLTGIELVAGLEERRQWYRQWYGADPDPLRYRRTRSAFAGLTLDGADGRLQVLPAWRWQRNEDDFPPLPALPWLPEEQGVHHRRDDVSPSVGAVYALREDRLYLQGHAARSVRVPTWIELFGHRGGIAGNRDLQPEEVASADVALTWKGRRQGQYGRASFFVAEAEQTIVFVQNSPGTSQALNIGRTLTRGVELEGGLVLPDGLRLGGAVTWQSARDRGEDPAYRHKRLPFLSDLVARLRLARVGGSWRPWLELVRESSRYRDRANTEINKAPSRDLVHLGLSRSLDLGKGAPAPRLTVAAEVLNVLDNRVYDIEQFPLPGRSWQLSVRLSR